MPIYQLNDGVLTATLPNGCFIKQDKHPQTNEPITEANSRAVLEACVSTDQWQTIIKLEGVAFEGVMCSATKDDQAGLLAVWMDYVSSPSEFQPTRFDFSNGSKLVLTKDNLPAFRAVWGAFRRQFFSA